MAGLAAVATVGKILGGVSALVSAAGTVAAGKSAQLQANLQAEMQRREGTEENARYQRSAITARNERDLLLSKSRANAAASGFDASDPAAVGAEANIDAQGTYNAGLISYTGARNKAYADYQGDLTEWAGKQSLQSSKASAFGTVLGGLGGMFASFGGKGYAPAGGPMDIRPPQYAYFGT